MKKAEDDAGNIDATTGPATIMADPKEIIGLLESMLDGFVAVNHDWVYTYVNAQAERLLLTKREDILQRCIWDCFPELIGTEIAERIHTAMEQRIVTEIEDFYQPLQLWLEIRVAPTPQGITIFFRDVTIRHQQEEALRASHETLRATDTALRQSEERFRALTEQSSDLVTVLDPTGAILYDSPSITTIFGYQPDDRIGKNVFQYLHPDEIPGLREIWEQAILEQHRDTRTTYRLLHADGSWRWAESVASAQIDNPVIHGIVVNTRDITERKQMENQLVQSGKLAALGELVAGVAHEINNPLSAISGHAQLLQMYPDPNVQQDGTVIQDMVERMTRLIRSLRTFAPIPTGKLEQFRSADLNQVVYSALDVIGGRLRSRSVELSLNLASDLPSVLIHEGEIEQVIINLLVNAEQAVREFDPEQRHIHIATSYRPAAECRNDQRPCCVLTVADSGPGIPPEILSRIFEPFFTTKDVGEGTGLGLAISHSIIGSHGGSLTAHNRHPENGATFTVELPAAP